MDDAAADRIKELLSAHIRESEAVAGMVAKKRFDLAIKETVSETYDAAAGMAQKGEAVGVMATVLLHHMLTRALIRSQRKIEYNGVPIDIAVPDLKTLREDPKRALVISVPMSSDVAAIRSTVRRLEKIQPEGDNIWVVLSEDADTGHRSFVLGRDGGTFPKIIFEIARFASTGGGNGRLRILGIGT